MPNNVQPGVTIDYATGESALADGGTAAEEPSSVVTPPQQSEEPITSGGDTEQADYVLNTNTMKFHQPSYSSVDDIKASNNQNYHRFQGGPHCSGVRPLQTVLSLKKSSECLLIQNRFFRQKIRYSFYLLTYFEDTSGDDAIYRNSIQGQTKTAFGFLPIQGADM